MLVFTVNVAVVDPAATVTLGGTVAADVLLLERETTAPPLGAGPFRVTVPAEGKPPVTVVGFSVSEERTGGITVSEAVLLGPPPYDAVIVTIVELATALVVTLKVALLAPAGMVTLPLFGTEATDELLLERKTTAPPLGAGPFNLALPVEEVPPVRLVGLRASEERMGGITVSEAVWGAPPP